MMWFPELPVFDGNSSGVLCIPEELPPYEEIDSEDSFLQAIIESMSRPVRGGHRGENQNRPT